MRKNRVNYAKILLVLFVFLSSTIFQIIDSTNNTYADSYDDKINALQQQSTEYNRQLQQLQTQANTLQNKINELNIQQNVIQNQININQDRYNQLSSQIEQTKNKISIDKKALGKIIAELYVSDSVSPVEMLASSKNIGDYLDKQEYRSSIKTQILLKINDVKVLQASLEGQKNSLTGVLNSQKAQETLLASNKSNQQQLLDETHGDESLYQSQIQNINATVQKYREAQAAQMAWNKNHNDNSVYTATSYPWANASTNYNDNCVDNSTGANDSDNWGYCYRQCTSYVAWKLATDNRGNTNFSKLGNAQNWAYYGSQVYSESDIQAGDVIVSVGGYYGHVRYVDSVSNGTVYYSQYNWTPYQPSSGSMSAATAISNYSIRRFH